MSDNSSTKEQPIESYLPEEVITRVKWKERYVDKLSRLFCI
jgi:hypothetical protein